MTRSASCACDQLLELLDLARTDIRRDIDVLALLEHAADDDQTGRLRQAPDLVQGVVGRDLAVRKDDPDKDRLLATIHTLGALVFDQVGNRPRMGNGCRTGKKGTSSVGF